MVYRLWENLSKIGSWSWISLPVSLSIVNRKSVDWDENHEAWTGRKFTLNFSGNQTYILCWEDDASASPSLLWPSPLSDWLFVQGSVIWILIFTLWPSKERLLWFQWFTSVLLLRFWGSFQADQGHLALCYITKELLNQMKWNLSVLLQLDTHTPSLIRARKVTSAASSLQVILSYSCSEDKLC